MQRDEETRARELGWITDLTRGMLINPNHVSPHTGQCAYAFTWAGALEASRTIEMLAKLKS